MIQMGFCQSPVPSSDNCDTTNVRIMISNNMQVKIGGGGATATWSWRDPFQIFTTILLTLLFPLSFLLLARLSTAHYLLASTTISQPSTTIISRLFLYSSKSIILYALVSLVSAAAFVHGLTAAAPLITLGGVSSPIRQQHPRDSGRPTSSRLYVAWVVLCTFQVCVGLGIEGSISAKIDGLGFGSECKSNLVIRALLLVGLHEGMVFWSKSVVKPVVEDTVLMGSSSSSFVSCGYSNNVRDDEELVGWAAAERVGMALSLGALWWWRLSEEVDSMVVVPEVMLGAGGGIKDVGVGGFVGWWLYYLTVSMGSMRAMKAVIWMGMGMVSAVQQLKLVCENKSEKKSRKENDFSPSSLTPSSSSLPTNHHDHLPPALMV